MLPDRGYNNDTFGPMAEKPRRRPGWRVEEMPSRMMCNTPRSSRHAAI
ncbi:MAG TPA: hypothetical protein VF418_07250 [Sphingomonadaceae bacterium]